MLRSTTAPRAASPALAGPPGERGRAGFAGAVGRCGQGRAGCAPQRAARRRVSARGLAVDELLDAQARAAAPSSTVAAWRAVPLPPLTSLSTPTDVWSISGQPPRDASRSGGADEAERCSKTEGADWAGAVGEGAGWAGAVGDAAGSATASPSASGVGDPASWTPETVVYARSAPAYAGPSMASISPQILEPGLPPQDLHSFLLEERVVFLREPLTDEVASRLVAQLIALDLTDPRKEIQLWINSVEASPYAATMAVDAIRAIRAPVATVALGRVRGAGALALLAAGARGRRASLPHTRLILQPPVGAAGGSAPDVEVAVRELKRAARSLLSLVAESADRTLEEVEEMFSRQKYVSAQQGVALGLLDKVIGEEAFEPAERWPEAYGTR